MEIEKKKNYFLQLRLQYKSRPSFAKKNADLAFCGIFLDGGVYLQTQLENNGQSL